MSDTSPPDWLGPAGDLLREHSLDEAAVALEAGLAAIELMEEVVRADLNSSQLWRVQALAYPRRAAVVALIAMARGETPEETVARLTPEGPPREPIYPARFPVQAFSDANATTPLSNLIAMRDMIQHRSIGSETGIHLNGPAAGSEPHPAEPISPRRSTLSAFLRPRLSNGQPAPERSRRRLP